MRRNLSVVFVAVAVLAVLIAALNLPGRDFHIYWSAAQAVRAGHSPLANSY